MVAVVKARRARQQLIDYGTHLRPVSEDRKSGGNAPGSGKVAPRSSHHGEARLDDDAIEDVARDAALPGGEALPLFAPIPHRDHRLS